ncbi:hypothetical protein ABFA07_003447 [Porites harrisoni]
MADNNSWVPLVQILERLFPNVTPQIVPAAHNAKAVLQAIQSSLNSKEIDTLTQIHCKWCGRVVCYDSNPLEKSKVAIERILAWDLDWSKKVLKIKGVQICCQECHLLLDLKKLLNFLVTLDGSTDITKLYSLASHFCQINGHTSQSGEADVKLLQQAVSITHSLHVLTKIVPDITVQGVSGENVTLESVDEVVESVCGQLPGSVQKYTPKVKRKKKKEKSFTEDTELTPDSSTLSVKKFNSTSKKKKKKQTFDSLTNGQCNSDHEEAEEPTRKRLILSEKRKKRADGKTRVHGKKRRSLPAMKLD